MITREKFLKYEKVRRSGAFNMFDLQKVCQMSGLTREDALEIMKTYEKLMAQYLRDVQEEGKK